MRSLNFSAGPAVLPDAVLEQAQAELLDYQGTGMSIMEQSHRGKSYSEVHQAAADNLKSLLAVPAGYSVLFMQGGATGQFALVPMNLRGAGQVADYTNSGSWGKKAIAEAKITGAVHVAADTGTDLPTCVPEPDALDLSNDAAYVHITSNETISGAQWKTFPKTKAPLVADMSSDILSRPLDIADFGLIYAGAQKNLGPAGVTIVILRDDLADRAGTDVPAIFRYKTHLEADSLYNTPPTFSVYLVSLVTAWLKEQGGLAAMEQKNHAKATKLYDLMDASSFYKGTAKEAHRSTMNVTFRLPTEDLEAAFIAAAGEQGMTGLKGHRSVGGIRASIYNAFPEAGVDALVALMKDFEAKNG